MLENGAERIFVWVSGQTTHRQRNENRVISANIALDWAGLIAALVIVPAVVWVARELAIGGHDFAAFGTVIGALTLLGGAFAYARWTGKEERIEKAKIMAGQEPNG